MSFDLGGFIRERLERAVPAADLDERDPDFIRDSLALGWLLSTFYFRAEVRGIENIPAEGPVLLVGNHSGGNVTPDSFVLGLAFNTYFGVERPFYQLAHNLVMLMPQVQWLRRMGMVAASRENAARLLARDAAVLVYPGGDWEVHRPTWQSASVDFAGRKGFLKMALERNVPIVPVVGIGGQETALFLSRGEWLARLLGLDRLLRLKVLPISIAAPWGLNIGDFVGHLPLPAKITVSVLRPVDLRKRFGPDPDLEKSYNHITRAMQRELDKLAAERALPLLG